MKRDRVEEGRLSERGAGLGTVTEEMVMKRARELAVINGRSAHNVLDSDLSQARRELTGEEGLVPERTASELVPEDERWEAVAPESGQKATNIPAPDEQTFAEKLVEEGVQDAEHDQMIKATRQALRRDKEGE